MAQQVFDNGFKRITIAPNGEGSIRFIIRDLVSGAEIISVFTGGEVVDITELMADAADLNAETADDSWNVDYHSRRPED